MVDQIRSKDSSEATAELARRAPRGRTNPKGARLDEKGTPKGNAGTAEDEGGGKKGGGGTRRGADSRERGWDEDSICIARDAIARRVPVHGKRVEALRHAYVRCFPCSVHAMVDGYRRVETRSDEFKRF